MPDETRYEPHQSSLLREPSRCPHCGEPLPQEPEVLRPSERIHDPIPYEPDVRYSHQRRRVEIFAGESGYSEADPMTIGAERVTTVADVARWMAIVAATPWTRSSERFLLDLGSALVAAFDENGSTAAT